MEQDLDYGFHQDYPKSSAKPQREYVNIAAQWKGVPGQKRIREDDSGMDYASFNG
jgi:hypothetical protein